VRALERLFDDASQFPPGNLNLEAAVAAHTRWHHDPHGPLVGRFLLPATRVRAFADLTANGADRFELGLVVPADLPERAATEAAQLLCDCARVTAVELPPQAGPALIAAWREAFESAELFVEGKSADLAGIGRVGGRPKLRCGGLEPAAVPSVQMIAAFVAESVALGLPFKATAGLHQPLRHFDTELGVEVHGFLNLWVATHRAQAGASRQDIEETLTSKDLGSLEPFDEGLVAARKMFTGFGTCSLREPIEGLADLGLLDE
jgi:hypothetical protein